jgi:hypothetical protein
MFQKVFNVAEESQFANRSSQTSTKFVSAWTGPARSQENRENVSKALKGKTKSKEHIDKLKNQKLKKPRETSPYPDKV